MHFDTVLELGFDFGADGGLGWDTLVTALPSGSTNRNEGRADALGAWQLGRRRVNAAEYKTLTDFFHAMRGAAHTFLYRDWNDHRATNEQLVINGTATTQLIKSYGLAINGWSRQIRKPDASSVVVQKNTGSGFVTQTPVTNYTLNASTGVITWVGTPPNTPNQVRWSGKFFCVARFDQDRFDAQFVAAQGDAEGDEAYSDLGTLRVVEDSE